MARWECFGGGCNGVRLLPSSEFRSGKERKAFVGTSLRQRQNQTNRPIGLRIISSNMKRPTSKAIRSCFSSAVQVTASTLAILLLAAVCTARAGDERDHRRDHRPPAVPAILQVPAGNALYFHATGVGVQIYVWTVNPTNAALSSWVFKAPHAVLFHREECVVGIHFAGPTWETNDGSKVVGTRLAASTVDSTAIPWLLLQAASTAGVGIFADTTYIQRVNTAGGLAPSTPGSDAGEEALVPYIADYYFYHAR